MFFRTKSKEYKDILDSIHASPVYDYYYSSSKLPFATVFSVVTPDGTAYLEDEDNATSLASSLGVDYAIRSVFIFDNRLFLLDADTPEIALGVPETKEERKLRMDKIRSQALKKLTGEERKALGLLPEGAAQDNAK